jgi:hypothetical protein
MNIKEMHYDFKQKINKIDSQQYRNLKVPEIDWKLNEAIELFVKIVAEPKHATKLGFELSQRVIDDIRPLVTDTILQQSSNPDKDPLIEIWELPTDYMDYVSTEEMSITQGAESDATEGCKVRVEKVIVRQHDDNFQSSLFDKSSFLWREVNVRFFDEGIKVFTSGEFWVTTFRISYIKHPRSVNNSESYIGGTYQTLAGVTLTTNVSCELPVHVHREIVDLAVAITTGDLQIPDYQIKRDKLGMNQLS